MRSNRELDNFSPEGTVFDGSGKLLKNGIWPRSVIFWLSAFYMVLFIIRPWEILIPQLGPLHFERVYALCMITVVFFSNKTDFQMTSQSTAVLLFLGALGLSGLLAVNPALAWDPFYRYLSLVVFYFILVMVLRTPYELVLMVVCYIATMAIYLGKSQWEYFVNDAGRWDMGVKRMWGIEGTFGYPNAVAESVILTLPMLAFLWSIRKELSCGWPHLYRRWFPRFLIIYFALAVSSILLTNSRMGMLAFILFLLLTSFSTKQIRKSVGYCLLSLFILASLWQFMPVEKKNRFQTLWDHEANPWATASAEGRKQGFHAGMVMFKHFPITGVGIGNFNSYRIAHIDGSGKSAHNLVGQILGETGLVGGIAFFLIIYVILVNCRRVRGLSHSGLHAEANVLSKLAVACSNSVVLILFTGISGHNMMKYNWLWLAAFSSLAIKYAKKNLEKT